MKKTVAVLLVLALLLLAPSAALAKRANSLEFTEQYLYRLLKYAGYFDAEVDDLHVYTNGYTELPEYRQRSVGMVVCRGGTLYVDLSDLSIVGFSATVEIIDGSEDENDVLLLKAAIAVSVLECSGLDSHSAYAISGTDRPVDIMLDFLTAYNERYGINGYLAKTGQQGGAAIFRGDNYIYSVALTEDPETGLKWYSLVAELIE